MRNASISMAALAALLLMFAVPSQVRAQDNTAGQATFGNLIAALNNVSVQINNLEALNNIDVRRVRVVSADNLLRGANIEALNNALNRNEVEIVTLRNTLNNNRVLNDFLKNNNVLISDVIAIDVLSGGEIVIFTTCDGCVAIP